ncbi:gustatory receptor for sugar taste 64f-like [Lycorma delicatula]|uniref:gustatory receptor for sugar taste 64f-like n=1 Tax=Lycorma delicatula TaxID=130591 RepID=UPI003F515C27
MHYNIRFILGAAAALGTFPVSRLTNPNPKQVQFKWISFPMAYTLFLLSGFLYIEITSIQYSIEHINQAKQSGNSGFKKATSGTIFYGNACVGVYLFIQLARKWPFLIREWHAIEISMMRYGSPKLLCRFITTTGVFMVLAFTEHICHDLLSTRGAVEEKEHQYDFENTTRRWNFGETFLIFLERYSLNSHWYLFTGKNSYNIYKGLFILWFSLTATLIWNFIDLFIMLISAALAKQFNILNQALQISRGKVLKQSQWQEYRQMYASMTILVKTVDQHVNKIITISVANNVYFICAQLITEIDSIKQDYIPSLFYFYSFLFLVGRTTAVVMQAAAVHDESLKVSPELFLCPSQSYCTEVQRFLQEVTSDHVALTGLNMFSITRNFLLGIAGAILTYEIVLIQLQNSK